MCDCGFGHGDLPLKEYIEKAAKHRDGKVLAELKKNAIDELARAIAAINEMEPSWLFSFDPEVVERSIEQDQQAALDLMQMTRTIDDAGTLLNLLDYFLHSAVAENASKTVDRLEELVSQAKVRSAKKGMESIQEPMMRDIVSFLIAVPKRGRSSRGLTS